MMDDIDYMNDNDYFELSPEEKKKLKNEVSRDLQRLVINICSQWDDMYSSIDYLEFGGEVQVALEDAMKELDCPWVCGRVWGAH